MVTAMSVIVSELELVEDHKMSEHESKAAIKSELKIFTI